MPAANLLSLASNGAPTAPATGATPGIATGTPFDAILIFEEMAASVGDTGVDAGSAELGTDAAGSAAEDVDGEDSTEDLDDPLAFLAGLLSFAPPPLQTAAGQAGELGSEPAEGGEADGSGHAAVAGMSLTLAEGPDSPILTDGTDATKTGAKTGDDAAAAKRLAAQAALVGTDAPKTDDKAAAARALDLVQHAPRGAAAVEHAPIATHARDPRWAEEFNTRIAMMVGKAESVAALSLTPLDLGPVEVNITVKDSQATIQFGAAHAETRQLIESSLPKLRELLAAQGFNLTDASVSQGFSRQPRKSESPSIPRPGSVTEVAPVAGRRIEMNGLLDTYA